MSELVPIVAIVALAGILIYTVTLASTQIAQHFRAGRFHDTERDLLRARIEQLANPIAKIQSDVGEFAWSGFRKFVLKGKVLEAQDICSFYLTPHDGQPLPPYLPGQYLTFQTQIPGIERVVTRCYSLSDSPHNPDYYRITVKRIPPDQGDPEGKHGLVSTHFQHAVEADDLIDVKAPAGHFYLDTNERGPVVLIGGGIGITPLLSMLNYITATGSTRETWLFYGVQNGSQHVQKEYMRQLAAEHENVRLHVCYSQPGPDDVLDEDYHHAERVSVDLLKRLLPSSNYSYYTCGPAAMMNQITQELKDWGVPKEHVHYEVLERLPSKASAKPSRRPLPVRSWKWRSLGPEKPWFGTAPILHCSISPRLTG